MSDRTAGAAGALLRITVPVAGDLRAIVADVAAKVAEYAGQAEADPATLAAAVDRVAAQVAPADPAAEITFEFRQSGGGLVIEARSGNQSSEVCCPLPA